MEKKELKKIEELLKDSDSVLIATKTGTALVGSTPNLMTLYTILTKNMMDLNHMNKELLDETYELAFKSDDEIREKAMEMMHKFIDRMMGGKNE